MKKSFLVMATTALILMLVAVNFGSVSAKSEPASASSVGNPTVTFVSGDSQFTTEITSTADIAGTTTLASGMLVPSGFPSGEKQFEGSALVVKGFDQGKMTVCFPFTGKNVGWGGKVGVWSGSAWNLLDTTLTTPEESNVSWACATATASGQYAFIKWVVDATLLPKEAAKPACTYEIQQVILASPEYDQGEQAIFTQSDPIFEVAILYTTSNLDGLNLKLTFLQSIPAGAALIDGKAKNILLGNSPLVKATDGIYVIPLLKKFPVHNVSPSTGYIVHLDFGSCAMDFTEKF